LNKKWFPYFVGILLIIIDQFSKALCKTIIKNTGVAFSLFSHHVMLITIFIGIFCTIILYIWTFKIKNILWKYTFALLFAGAISNEIDRIFRGYVIDFIDYKGFFVGNIADIFVCISAFFIIILLSKNIKW
jgi:signal peptidase II